MVGGTRSWGFKLVQPKDHDVALFFNMISLPVKNMRMLFWDAFMMECNKFDPRVAEQSIRSDSVFGL